MTVNHTFKTANPEHLAVFEQAKVAYKDHWGRITAWAQGIHPNAMAYGSSRRPANAQGVSGLTGPKVKTNPERTYSPTRVDTLDPVPEGWRWMKTYDCYRPITSKAGTKAKEAIKDINAQGVPDATYVLMQALGLPTEVWMPGHVYWPGTWIDLEGSIWICYGVRLDADNRSEGSAQRQEKYLPDVLPEGLTEQPLSSFHLAREQWDAAHPKTDEDEVA